MCRKQNTKKINSGGINAKTSIHVHLYVRLHAVNPKSICTLLYDYLNNTMQLATLLCLRNYMWTKLSQLVNDYSIRIWILAHFFQPAQPHYYRSLVTPSTKLGFRPHQWVHTIMFDQLHLLAIHC